ncbi:MAG: ABC transporter ATP-binding protein [Phycisphaerales bacterium]
MNEAIVARGLHKSFGDFEAVCGIDLIVRPGEVLGFLGPNGAGKSTTMRMLTGYLAPTSGTVRICGIDLDGDPIGARSRFGYLPEGAPVYPEMTVAEFLRFIAAVRGCRGEERRRRVDAAVARTQLGGVLHQTVETLSKGFKRRVGLAQAILHDPEVLILDEPTDGLDPNQKHEVRRLIREMAGAPRDGAASAPAAGGAAAGRRKAIVLSTHILEEVEAVCTRAVIIDRGRIVFDGTPAELDAKAPSSLVRNRLDHVFRELTSSDSSAGAMTAALAKGASR